MSIIIRISLLGMFYATLNAAQCQRRENIDTGRKPANSSNTDTSRDTGGNGERGRILNDDQEKPKISEEESTPRPDTGTIPPTSNGRNGGGANPPDSTTPIQPNGNGNNGGSDQGNGGANNKNPSIENWDGTTDVDRTGKIKF